MIQALLLSASKADNTGYLEHAIPMISEYLDLKNLESPLNVVFVPYAGVTISFDEYTQRVKTALTELPLAISGLHEHDDQANALKNADVVLVGGGNTFALLNRMYQNNLIEVLHEAVESGVKYIGWSAGSNLAGLSIKTTNDMPIVAPPSFDALGLLPVQINPHYTDFVPPGHHGETRQMRIEEFMVLEPNMPVIGIQEGTALLVSGGNVDLIGPKCGYLFKGGKKQELAKNTRLNEWIGQ